MNTDNKHLLILIFKYFILIKAQTQSTYRVGVLPTVNINYKFKNTWALNTRIESRQSIITGEFKGKTNNNYKYILTDYSVIISKKTGLNSRITGGYLIRTEDKDTYHRLIQQYIIIVKMDGYRLSHRFMSDQSFSKVENTQIRLRYRLSAEIPLNGKTVEPKEFYLKINTEYINSWQNNIYEPEIRLSPLIGVDLTNKHNIEFGLDYRVNSFLKNTPNNNCWMSLNWYIEI